MLDGRKLVICAVDDPSPVAYANVYEKGDLWEKIQGCEACRDTGKCCNNCGMFHPEVGCTWHRTPNLATTNKPWNCIVKPHPDAAMSFCALQFKCTIGSNKGKVRRVCDSGNILIEEG